MDRQRKMIILAIAALILVMILAAKVGFSQEERTGDQSCQQMGWEFGCKLDGAHSGTFLCDNGTNITAQFSGCDRSSDPECKTLDWKSDKDFIDLVSIKGGPGHEDYTYPAPGALSDRGLAAPDGKDISHVHWCWDKPGEPKLGAGCLSDGDFCLEGVTKEQYFAHEFAIEDGWTLGLGCRDLVCSTNIELGGGCLKGTIGNEDGCIDGIKKADYYELEGAIENGWTKDATCENLVCSNVPTMPTKVLATLAILLTITAGYFLRR